jgi:hypothetical protein
MKTFVLTCAAVLFGFSGIASAQQRIASPALPGAIGNAAACYVRNTGTSATAVAVSTTSTLPIVANVDTCNGGPLAAGKTCVLLFNNLPDFTFLACSATALNTSRLRGTLEIREKAPTLRVLVSEELR